MDARQHEDEARDEARLNDVEAHARRTDDADLRDEARRRPAPDGDDDVEAHMLRGVAPGEARDLRSAR